MTRVYGKNEWHEDLKRILGQAIVYLNQHVVFLFNDSEVNKIYDIFENIDYLKIYTD